MQQFIKQTIYSIVPFFHILVSWPIFFSIIRLQHELENTPVRKNLEDSSIKSESHVNAGMLNQ